MNGSKQSEGFYYDGLKSGHWIYYDSKETISSEGEYANNLKDGYWKNYTADILISEGWMIKNKQALHWKYYNEKGIFTHSINH